jgi:predicted alpha/beta hydrolase family esterase
MPDVERPDFIPAIDRAFAPIPREPFHFPSILIASRTDPHCDYAKAEDIAYAWGSAIVDAGDAGHLNTESGHGPWPEGLMRFAGFLKRL